ncbi:SDR family NAD(P)-dependent oxidoreductase [Agitococcus lubricus]|uniref:Short-subunit dehydrogenase n=1 Tax=Agitococcus lubricus TaxID=1077255 RepID=A0A2T5IYW5_9GAMM|nr:SDR family NAD(P)-dependent oxidoreductase [Agitococcus lubricus]PTQ89205.1 short-subunit dehydrogenase [Agitococcus lubricus]
MKQFYGRKVIITGAGNGLGRLLALAFAARGADVIVTDLNYVSAEKVAAEILDIGRQAWAYALDIADLEAISSFKQQIHRDIGKIDALVNNAAIVFGGAFEMMPLDKHLLTQQVNNIGLMAITHTFFTDLLESPDSHIVNIASASGYIGLPYGSSYAASKWAVIGLSESIRLELAERGFEQVGVTTVCSGYLTSGMFEGIKPPALLANLSPEKVVDKIMEAIERNQPFVKEPLTVKSVDLLRAALSQKWWDKAAKALGISTSMNQWKGNTR